VQRELMRHSTIAMTMDTYGRTPITDAQRDAASKVAALALKADFKVISTALSN
jgi:hypothetical protein